VSSQWYYRPGDYYQLDDLSGFKIRASRSRRIPGGQTGGAIVAPERWEPQQPQDFVQGVADDQTVPEPRPRQPDQFTIVAGFVVAYAPARTGWITIDNALPFNVLDYVTVMLDTGEPFYATIIQKLPLANQLLLTPVLPHSVGGNIGTPIENTIIVLGPSNQPLFLTQDRGIPVTDDAGNLFSTSR
jgi:hypothetical protein